MSTNSTTSSTSVQEVTSSTSGTSLSSSQPSPTSSSISSADDSPTPSPASSDAGPTTTSSTSTSSDTPLTSATTTATPQTSPSQTSASATTTTPSTSSSTSSTSVAAQTTNPSSSFTTQVATTIFSTNSAGSTVFVTTTYPVVTTSSAGSSTGGSSSSHTGVIVGSVVGGVAGLAILALLFFCIRRRVRKDEFDGNFDPDRIVGHNDGDGGTLPNVDLANEVTPFPQSYTDQGSSSMRQYGDTPYVAVPSLSASDSELYPSSAGGPSDAQLRSFARPGPGSPPSGAYLPPVNVYGAGPLDWQTRVSPPPSTVSHNSSSARAAKEREALGRNNGHSLGLATQHEDAEGSGDVVVHQDGGRAPVEEHVPQPREIPPAYESIPQD